MEIVSVVGARPQFIKLKPVHESILRAGFSHRVIHTGQHYDQNMSEVFFRGLELPSPNVNLGIGSGSHAETTGKMLVSIEKELLLNRPDVVVVYGDTNSTMAAAIATSKLRIPIGHVESGLRSFNKNMPEEINRVTSDHISDLLFAPTELAMRNLSDEGLSSKSFLTGDVMADLIFDFLPKLGSYTDKLSPDNSKNHIVATIHRQSNTDDETQLRTLIGALHKLSAEVIIVAHPRLISAANKFGIQLTGGNVVLIEPLPYLEMLSLLWTSNGLVTDSGGLQKEAFLLGVPCVTLRTETEWPETFENNMNILCPGGENLEELVNRNVNKIQSDSFGQGNASDEIVRIISEYIN